MPHEPFGVELDHSVYALDSTTIDLCLSLFPWAQFRKRKAAVKLHTLLDLRGSIPSVVIVTSGKVHDVRILDQLPIESGAIYILDRGYIDFARLHSIHLAGAFFVTRAKNNFRFQRLYSQPVSIDRRFAATRSSYRPTLSMPSAITASKLRTHPAMSMPRPTSDWCS